ncbi:MAG: RNase P modulator RnpM [Bacillota bacterium]
MPKTKKIPQRKCLGCLAIRPKKELIRLVRTPEGELVIDPTGRKPGRGAYLCPRQVCLDKLKRSKLLGKNLEVRIESGFWDELARFLQERPADHE